MKQPDFQKALMKAQFKCRNCNHTWFSFDARRPKQCPVCTEAQIARVSGEGIRRRMYWDRLESVLTSLTYREREVIKLRYGIGDGYIYTLRQVGRIFKLSHARIHQIEAKAIRKLTHPVRAEKLRRAGLLTHYARLTMPKGMAALIRRISDGMRTRHAG